MFVPLQIPFSQPGSATHVDSCSLVQKPALHVLQTCGVHPSGTAGGGSGGSPGGSVAAAAGCARATGSPTASSAATSTRRDTGLKKRASGEWYT